MKLFFVFPVISLFTFSNYSSIKFSSAFQTDTTAIIHLLDGHIAEWPEEKFINDKSTKTRYAIDNDSQMLFLALNVPETKEQQKIMQQGMSLFIDVKGKKRENRGVQFPLGMESGVSIENMKVFGFNYSEPLPQNVKTEGTINIAIAWDTSYVMNIEYSIPLKMLEGSIAELNNKKISIGWKINEIDVMSGNTTQPVSVTSRVVGVQGTSRPPSNPNTRPTRTADPFPQSNAAKAQPIWATHTIIF